MAISGGRSKLGKCENVGWKNWGMGEEGNWRMDTPKAGK